MLVGYSAGHALGMPYTGARQEWRMGGWWTGEWVVDGWMDELVKDGWVVDGWVGSGRWVGGGLVDDG